MFQRKKTDLLPMASGSAKANPLAATPLPKLPKAQTATYASWGWLVFSIGLLLLGVRLAATSTNFREIVCDAEACTFSIRSTENKDDEKTIRFARHDLVKVESVRMKAGKIRDTTNMRRKQTRKLGYSYAITYKDPDTQQEVAPIPMSITSIGRKRPRLAVNEIQEYIDNERSSVKLRESSGFDWRGLLCIIFGIFSLLFCALLGQFTDPKPRPKQRRRTVTRKR